MLTKCLGFDTNGNVIVLDADIIVIVIIISVMNIAYMPLLCCSHSLCHQYNYNAACELLMRFSDQKYASSFLSSIKCRFRRKKSNHVLNMSHARQRQRRWQCRSQHPTILFTFQVLQISFQISNKYTNIQHINQ